VLGFFTKFFLLILLTAYVTNPSVIVHFALFSLILRARLNCFAWTRLKWIYYNNDINVYNLGQRDLQSRS